MPDDSRAEGLSPAATAFVGLARRTLGTMSDAERNAGMASLRAAMSGRRRARTARRTHALMAVGLMAAATAVILLRRERHSALSFRVDGADVRPGGSVEADATSRPVLRFSDGSEVALSAMARVHVRTIDEHGARVTLDEGQAHVYVVHVPDTRWVFDAGPFVVAVTGTAFGISWAGAERRLDVRLENGTVTVSGPVSDGPLALRAGQWLTVRANDVLIRSLDAPGPSLSAAPPSLSQSESGLDAPVLQDPASPETRPDASDGIAPRMEDMPVRRATSSRRASVDANHAWASDLASGRFGAIVDDALRIGLESAFSTSSTDELAALADAARYTRRHDIARGALLAQRRRFPATDHARVAAFSLGRLSETEADPRAALSWFEDYLSEAPDGTYASEALGRKMTIVQRLDGRDSARPLAETYLRRFPSGTYAQAAKALTLRP